jgi:hypothetical protein
VALARALEHLDNCPGFLFFTERDHLLTATTALESLDFKAVLGI